MSDITDDIALGGSFGGSGDDQVQVIPTNTVGPEPTTNLIVTDDSSLGGSFGENGSPEAITANDTAVSAANEAKVSQAAAYASELAAAASASSALTSETDAASSADASAASASQSAASAISSETSAVNAETSNLLAAQHVVDAENEALAASNSASGAAASAAAAAASEASAESSDISATTASIAAQQYSLTSVNSAAASASSAAASLASADLAETSEDNAALSEANAAASSTAASDSEDLAMQWATSVSLVDSTAFYGAYKYAQDAAASATVSSQASATAVSEAQAASASETNATASATEASLSANASETSAVASAASATQAGSSATQALDYKNQALTAAQNAQASETSVAANTVTASAAALAASTSETNAGLSEVNAINSEAAAASSAVSAASSASDAQLSADAANVSEANAASSALEASLSEAASFDSETNADISEASALVSKDAAAASAVSASTSASAAAVSETNASSSELAASGSATDAANSATASAASATASATSATNSAGSAATSLTAQAASEAARDAALAAFDSFDDRYLGQKTDDPTTDNDGDPLVAGTLYFNTTTDTMKVYEGAQWVSAYASLSGVLLATNNLSDLTDVSAARTNLDLGTIATADAEDYLLSTGGIVTGTIEAPLFEGDLSGAQVFPAKAGEAITKGDALYISGISGNTPIVMKANASDFTKMPSFGVSQTTVSANANVNCVTYGQLHNIDTTPFSLGDQLYVSTTSGELTATAPAGETSLIQNLGKVERVHASTGALFIAGAGRANATPNLDSGNFFLGNGSNQAVSADFDTSVTNIALPLAGGALTGAVTTTSTFDGRDVSVDGAKLDGIEANATADQTALEIKTAYESNANTNAFTDADESKLDGIEALATADQTAAEIRALVEAATDSNVFTDADNTKLDGIATNANNYVLPFTDNSTNWNTAYGWGNHASAGYYPASNPDGYTDDQTAAEILTAIKTVDGAGSGLDADLLDGQHETAFLKVSLGNAADLNASTYWRAGMFGWHSGTADRPPDNYGQGLSIVSSGSEHNNSTNWITQLAFGTNETTSYFRSKTNDGAWGAWHTIWNSANDGSGSGLDADLLDGLNSTSFVRSDANDTMNGQLTINTTNDVQLSLTSADAWTGIAFNDGAALGEDYIWHNGGNGTFAIGGGGANVANKKLHVHGGMTIGSNYAGTGVDANSLNVEGTVTAIAFNATNADTTPVGTAFANTMRSSDTRVLYLDGAGGTSLWQGSGNTAHAAIDTNGTYQSFWANNGLGWQEQMRIARGYIDLLNPLSVNGTTVIDSSRNLTNIGTLNGGTAWTSSNDGSGSGLDADLLDGVQASSFLRSDADDTLTGNLQINSHVINMDLNNVNDNAIEQREVRSSTWPYVFVTNSVGNDNQSGFWVGSNGYPDMRLRRENSTVRALISSWETSYVSNGFNINGNTAWHAGNDGSGSGLDADLLDGSHKVDIQKELVNVQTVTAADSCLPSTGYGFKHFLGLGPSNNDGHILGMTWTNTSSYGAQIYVDTDPNNIMAFRSRSSSGSWTSWNTVWHTSNDGSGSGLDADLLDGVQGTNYFRCDGTYPNTDMNATVEGYWHVVPSASNLPVGSYGHRWDWDHLNNGQWVFQMYSATGGSDDLWFRQKRDFGAQTWHKVWTTGNDGSGSGLDADLLDGYNSDNFLGKFGNSYFQANTWIQHTGEHGLYAPTINNAHFYPNGAASYGTWRIIGSRNGYTGIHLDYGGVNTAMYDSGGNGGEYHPSFGWYTYFSRGNGCMGIAGSSTSASYGLYESGGGIYSTGNIIAYSDRRVKENIRTIDNALETVEQMRGVYYNRIDDEEKKTVIGFIAQEVDEVEGAKPLVTYAADVDQYGVSYGNATALLVEAIKELSQQVKDLQKEIKELQND